MTLGAAMSICPSTVKALSADRYPGLSSARLAVEFHIAQINIGRARGAVDGPMLVDFMALLDPVNELADRTPGFVWRLQDEAGNATSLRPYDDDRMIVNMSTWESIDALWDFV